jgi:hypothetical protein
MGQISEETKKALEDKTPLIGHLRFQPQGYPRDAWRMNGVAHPSTWDRGHWSWKRQGRKRASNASKKPQSAVEAATKLLAKLLEKK